MEILFFYLQKKKKKRKRNAPAEIDVMTDQTCKQRRDFTVLSPEFPA